MHLSSYIMEINPIPVPYWCCVCGELSPRQTEKPILCLKCCHQVKQCVLTRNGCTAVSLWRQVKQAVKEQFPAEKPVEASEPLDDWVMLPNKPA